MRVLVVASLVALGGCDLAPVCPAGETMVKTGYRPSPSPTGGEFGSGWEPEYACVPDLNKRTSPPTPAPAAKPPELPGWARERPTLPPSTAPVAPQPVLPRRPHQSETLPPPVLPPRPRPMEARPLPESQQAYARGLKAKITAARTEAERRDLLVELVVWTLPDDLLGKSAAVQLVYLESSTEFTSWPLAWQQAVRELWAALAAKGP